MKKLLSTYLLNIIAAMALMMTAAACVDDTDLPEVAAPGTSVTIRIPNPAAADAFARSRAEADADSPANAATNVGASGSSPASAASRAEEKDLDTKAKEGDIHSLWLLAYNTDNSDYNVIRQLQSSGQLTHEYSEYRIEFKPGTYRIYVVANLDEYITGEISASTEESYLENLILNFSPDKLPNTDDGLPMACLPAQVDGADRDLGIITVEAGTTKTIQTDLTFLCAKVRYTILFDNSEGGFSREAFGSSAVTFNTASLTGVIPSTPLYGSVNASADAFEVDPIDPKVINDSKDLSDLADPGFTPSATGAQRAWQGTMYLPENLLTGARTILHLGATLDGNGANFSYTVKLPKNDNETASPENTLTRGHFYDLVGRVTTIGDQIDITASVADWTLQTLTYALHGPYFLHVDKTKIENLVAGLEETFTYETDAPDIKFESCDYDGKKLFIVDKGVDEETGKNYISVKVNPQIAASGAVLEGNEYYFDIIAANLRKRILVTPVKLTPFLNVSPTEIEINIAEYIASGDYDAEIPIEFTTNLPSVTITQTGGDWSNFPITVEDITTDGTVTYNNTSTRTNTLKITGFNEAKWTSEQKFQLTYTATPTSDDAKPKTVNITVKPNILDYVIHLRTPNWTMPHIYVYQCLQFPADLSITNRRSKPVGEDSQHAALEYAFTSKIAFKGWKGYGGPDCNDPTVSADFNGGFYIPTQYYNGIDYGNYKPSNTNRYYDNMDFSANHRKDITNCTDCKNGDNNQYPGISMIYEGNGWWKYTLTGIATPGKALIMFANGHSYADNMQRYPGNEQVGIPLFDYPNREGWFDLTGSSRQFSSTKPADIPYRTYRLYWPKSLLYEYLYWGNGTTNYTQFENAQKAMGSTSNGYFYFDLSIKSPYPTGNFKFLFRTDPDEGKYPNSDIEISVNNFILDEDGNYSYTWKSTSDNYSGKPREAVQEPNIYRLYWPYSSSFNGVNFWRDGKAWGNKEYSNYNSSTQQATQHGTYHRSTEYPGYAYLEFSEMSDAEFHCQRMPNPSSSNQTDGIYLSNFTGNGNIKSYTLNDNCTGGKSGIPGTTPAHNPTQFEPGMKITFKWNKDIKNSAQIHVWEEGGATLNNWGDTDFPISGNYRTETVTIQGNRNQINYILHSGSNQNATKSIYWNDVKNNHYNSTTNTVEWTIENL